MIINKEHKSRTLSFSLRFCNGISIKRLLLIAVGVLR